MFSVTKFLSTIVQVCVHWMMSRLSVMIAFMISNNAQHNIIFCASCNYINQEVLYNACLLVWLPEKNLENKLERRLSGIEPCLLVYKTYHITSSPSYVVSLRMHNWTVEYCNLFHTSYHTHCSIFLYRGVWYMVSQLLFHVILCQSLIT